MVRRLQAHKEGITKIRIMGEGDQVFKGAEDYEDINLKDFDFFPTTLLTTSQDKTVKLW
jgi:hypothetical protein